MNEVTHSIDSPVSLGPRLFFRYARSNLPEMQLLFRAGKLSPKFGNWDNVIRHCLVEAAETEVFSYLFNLPDNERTKLFKVALCHDWRQRLNKQENSLNNLPPDESASLKKEIDDADKYLNSVSPDPNLMATLDPGFSRQILDGKATLLQKLLFYIDNITDEDDIATFNQRIGHAEQRNSKLNEDIALTEKVGGRFWDVEREATQRVEEELFNILKNKRISIDKPEDIPLYIKREVYKLVEVQKEPKFSIRVFSKKEAGHPDKENEDTTLILESKNTLVVKIGDGATSLEKITDTNGKGNVSSLLAVNAAKQGIKDNFQSITSAKQLLLAANMKIKERLVGEGIDPERTTPEELPQEVATLVRIDKKGGIIDIAQIGDAPCIVEKKDGSIELALPLDVSTYDIKAMELAQELAKEKDLTLKEAITDSKVGQLTIQSRANTNSPDGKGFGALNGDPKADSYIKIKTYPLSEIGRIILLTDGMLLPTTHFGAEPNWGEIAVLVKQEGLVGLYQRVFELNNSDPNLDKYPRFKYHDDATGIIIDIVY